MNTSGGAELRVLIAAGGSGGHLVPAVLIADAIRRRHPAARVEFAGSGRPLEETILGAAGYRRHVVEFSGLNRRGLKGLLQVVGRLPRALAVCWGIFSSLRPQVVIGVGGYASFVPVTVAFLRGVPSWIHEAEYFPGTANWLLSLYAGRVSTAFPDAHMPRWARTVHTGHPLRPEIAAATTAAGSLPRHLLILGGSQGARALDDVMPRLADLLRARQIELYHQCRPENVDRLRDAYREAGLQVRVESFIRNMPEAYAWSDLIVSRAGANSVIEIGAVNRPAIFVPYPHSQGGHQTINARFLASAGKALIVEEGSNFEERLRAALESLLAPEAYRQMRSAPLAERSREAADAIAAGVIELAEARAR